MKTVRVYFEDEYGKIKYVEFPDVAEEVWKCVEEYDKAHKTFWYDTIRETGVLEITHGPSAAYPNAERLN